MAVAAEITDFRCPKCRTRVRPDGEQGTQVRCPGRNCRWSGQVFLFNPLLRVVDEAEESLPADATCTQHPTKRAVAVCDGSGDYICALCQIDLDGKTYSAEYLNRVGRDRLKAAFNRYLERPDRTIKTIGVLLIIPYLNLLGVIGLPYAFVKYFQMMKLRRQNSTYRMLVGRGGVWVCRVLLVIYGLLLAGGVALLISKILEARTHG